MNYRSVADLARCVRENLHRVPNDVDLVVGVPRSGLLAANLIALGLNLKLTDLRGLLDNTPLPRDNLRPSTFPDMLHPQSARHVLVVEDSVLSGGSMARVRQAIDAVGAASQFTYCAVYAGTTSCRDVDLAFEVVPAPRTFEWNLMHRELLEQCCVDIDGVLCPDPNARQNDDGERYANFLTDAPCLIRPTHRIGHLVSARLERYRPQTERWLARNGIRYNQLHLLDLPDAETRRKVGAHAPFKARVYRDMREAVLFIESDPVQAELIAHLSGKSVLCHTTQKLLEPKISGARVEHQTQLLTSSLMRKVRRLARRLVGE